MTLDPIERFATGIGPVVASFSPDGKYRFIGLFGDTDLLALNAETAEEVARIFIGASPLKVAVTLMDRMPTPS